MAYYSCRRTSFSFIFMVMIEILSFPPFSFASANNFSAPAERVSGSISVSEITSGATRSCKPSEHRRYMSLFKKGLSTSSNSMNALSPPPNALIIILEGASGLPPDSFSEWSIVTCVIRRHARDKSLSPRHGNGKLCSGIQKARLWCFPFPVT